MFVSECTNKILKILKSFEGIRLYSWSLFFFIEGARGECCGKGLNKGNKYICCEDKISKTALLHHKKQNLKCCKAETYNKKTHECLSKGPIRKGFRTCNEEPYHIASHICCNKQIYQKTKHNEDRCCGQKLFSSSVYECRDANLVPKGHRWCKAGKYLLRLFSLHIHVYVNRCIENGLRVTICPYFDHIAFN
jgi:hypothetical protein